MTCTRCIANGRWKESLKGEGKGCEICGSARRVSFSVRDFHRTEVDKKVVCDNPLEAFTEWLIYEVAPYYPKMVLSHFGGRFGRHKCL